MDCKYKPWMRDGMDAGDVSQMGVYSLTSALRDLLGYGSGDFCMLILFLYPDREGLVILYGHLWMRVVSIEGLYRVRRLPLLKDDYVGEGILA